MVDRASVLHRWPNQLDDVVVEQIEVLRRVQKMTARAISRELATEGHGVAVSTVSRWLVRGVRAPGPGSWQTRARRSKVGRASTAAPQRAKQPCGLTRGGRTWPRIAM